MRGPSRKTRVEFAKVRQSSRKLFLFFFFCFRTCRESYVGFRRMAMLETKPSTGP